MIWVAVMMFSAAGAGAGAGAAAAAGAAGAAGVALVNWGGLVVQLVIVRLALCLRA